MEVHKAGPLPFLGVLVYRILNVNLGLNTLTYMAMPDVHRSKYVDYLIHKEIRGKKSVP